jgi:hypothetical protein
LKRGMKGQVQRETAESMPTDAIEIAANEVGQIYCALALDKL